MFIRRGWYSTSNGIIVGLKGQCIRNEKMCSFIIIDQIKFSCTNYYRNAYNNFIKLNNVL